MKRILYLLLPILFLTLSLNSCAALKEQNQKKKRNTTELPPNTASNKYSKKKKLQLTGQLLKFTFLE